MTVEPHFVRYQSTMAQRRTFHQVKSITDLTQLSSEEFEACCAYLYEIEGYLASQNRQVERDVDLLLERGKERLIVRCGHFTNGVSQQDVQQLNDRLAEFGANAAVLLSTGPISRVAKSTVRNKPVKLISGREVFDWLRYTQATERQSGVLTGWLEANWSRIALLAMLVVSLGVLLASGAVGYMVYTLNNASEVEVASTEDDADDADGVELDDEDDVSAEPTSTITLLEQTPPAPTETPFMTAVPTATPIPTEAPTETPLPIGNVAINRFNVPPPLTTDLDSWPSIPAYTTRYVSGNSAEWDTIIDASSVWRLGWDASNLYGIVVVQDDMHVQTQPAQFAYWGDSVEIEIDTAFDRANVAMTDDYQYVISPGNFFNLEPEIFRFRGGARGVMSKLEGTQAAVVATQTERGYIIAFQIPWIDMNVRLPQPNTVYGVALNLNDNDVPATAQFEVQFTHTVNRQWSMPRTWGTLTLNP